MSSFVWTMVDAVTLYAKTLINPDYLDQVVSGASAPAVPAARISTLHPTQIGGSSTSSSRGSGGSSSGSSGAGGRPMGTIGGSSFRPSGVTPSMCSGGSCG